MSLRPYIDDTTGYYPDLSPTVLQFVVNSELSLLSSWFDQNHLLVNNDNTLAPPLWSHAHIITTQLALKGIKAGTLESMKTLGVTMDKLLIFKGHISGQFKKAYTKMCSA